MIEGHVGSNVTLPRYGDLLVAAGTQEDVRRILASFNRTPRSSLALGPSRFRYLSGTFLRQIQIALEP